MGLFDRFKKKNKIEDVKKSDSVDIGKKKEIKETEIKTTKPAEKTAVKKTPIARTVLNKILIRPLVSEKTATLEAEGTYAFVINKKSNKYQVKEAVREVYGIMPKKVRIVNVEGKRTNFGRMLGKRSDWKKAFVALPKGKTINIHEGV